MYELAELKSDCWGNILTLARHKDGITGYIFKNYNQAKRFVELINQQNLSGDDIDKLYDGYYIDFTKLY